jgi:hypothetical protein
MHLRSVRVLCSVAPAIYVITCFQHRCLPFFDLNVAPRGRRWEVQLAFSFTACL